VYYYYTFVAITVYVPCRALAGRTLNEEDVIFSTGTVLLPFDPTEPSPLHNYVHMHAYVTSPIFMREFLVQSHLFRVKNGVTVFGDFDLDAEEIGK